MTDPAHRAGDQGRPALDGERVRLRPGGRADAPALHAILAEPTVARWWGDGRDIGTEAVALLARYLIEQRGHHRLTIDPAAANHSAIRCYQKVGFRPVGVLREYERGPGGTFHGGLLMDLLRGEITRPPGKKIKPPRV